jgi:hypothetical protein
VAPDEGVYICPRATGETALLNTCGNTIQSGAVMLVKEDKGIIREIVKVQVIGAALLIVLSLPGVVQFHRGVLRAMHGKLLQSCIRRRVSIAA